MCSQSSPTIGQYNNKNMNGKMEGKPMRRRAYAGINIPHHLVNPSEEDIQLNADTTSGQKNHSFEVEGDLDMTISEESDLELQQKYSVKENDENYVKEEQQNDFDNHLNVMDKKHHHTDGSMFEKYQHCNQFEKGSGRTENVSVIKTLKNGDCDSKETRNAGINVTRQYLPCEKRAQTEDLGLCERVKQDNAIPKMIRRHSTMTLIPKQMLKRRDSVVMMNSSKTSFFSNTSPTKTSGRKLSLAVPHKPKQKPNIINVPGTPNENVSYQLKNVSKIQELESESQNMTVSINISYVNLTNSSGNKITLDLNDIKTALKEHAKTSKIELWDSSPEENIHKVTCKCGAEVTMVCDRFSSSDKNIKTYLNKEVTPSGEEVKLFTEDDMPPNNIGHTGLQSRQLSIEDVIEDLKTKPYVYESQLVGCKRLGRFAYGENLDVTLSQKDSVMCLLKAMKTFPDRPDLLKSAAKSLGKLTAIYEASSCHVCNNDGLHVLMKIFRTYNDNAELLLLIMDILGHISLNEDLSEDLVQSAVHSEILTTMSRHSDNNKIAKQCCFILGNLVNSVEVAQSLMFVGGVHAIIGTMERFSNNMEVLENGCRTLGCFAMHDEICQDVGNAGAVNAVIAGMRFAAENASVQECGCWALACLTKMDVSCQEMCKLGGINVVSSAMKMFREEVIQEYGCWIISNVSATESTIDHVAVTDILKTLTSAMLLFPDNIQMQQQTCFSISQMASYKEIQEVLVNNGHLQTMVNTMTSFSDDPEIQEYCCRIVGNIAVNESLRKSINCSFVSKAVISAMLTLDRTQQVQEYGCMALTNLTANVSENKSRVVQNGGLSAVMNTIKEFSTDESVVLCGLKTLANIMEIESACSMFMAEDGMEILSKMLSIFSDSSEIRLFICIVLSDLSIVNGVEEQTLSQAEELLFQALDDSSNDPDIHLCICQFYEHMVITGNGCDRFIKLRRISRVMSALKLHSGNMDIHYSGCKIIAAVSMYNGKGMSIINEEVVHLVVRTMNKFHSIELQTVCCGILSYVIENNENACELLRTNGGIDVIISAMRNNIHEERLQIVGLMTLESFRRKENMDQYLVMDDFNLTVEVMENFPDNAEIQMYGCSVLCLAGNSGSVCQETKRKALSLVTDILRRSKSQEDLQVSARNCLQTLLRGESQELILQLKSKISSLHDNVWEQILKTKQIVT